VGADQLFKDSQPDSHGEAEKKTQTQHFIDSLLLIGNIGDRWERIRFTHDKNFFLMGHVAFHVSFVDKICYDTFDFIHVHRLSRHEFQSGLEVSKTKLMTLADEVPVSTADKPPEQPQASELER
jgi:hypothetical protein